jgi:hypothetical protein
VYLGGHRLSPWVQFLRTHAAVIRPTVAAAQEPLADVATATFASAHDAAPVQYKCAACSAGGALCPKCEDERRAVQAKAHSTATRGLGGSLAAPRCPVCDGQGCSSCGAPPTVQAKAAQGGRGGSIDSVASRGVQGAGAPLPYLSRIQTSFGHHDVSSVRTRTGGPAKEASEALGARAFTTGDQIAFRNTPDLHLAAHEAAHVVQQRGGVRRKDLTGAAGDRYERHADAVADHVVQGRSAAALLDHPPGPANRAAPRRKAPVQAQLMVTATRLHEPEPVLPPAPASAVAAPAAPAAAPPAAPTPTAPTGNALDAARQGEPAPTPAATSDAGGAGETPSCTAPMTPTSVPCYAEPIEEPDPEPDTEAQDSGESGSAKEETTRATPFDADAPDVCEAEAAINQATDQAIPETPEPATPEGAGADGGGGGAETPEGAAPEGGGADARAVEASLSPIDAAIAATESRRDAAVSSFQSSDAVLDQASRSLSLLVGGVSLSQAPAEGPADRQRRRRATATLRGLFSTGAAAAEAAISRARLEVPGRLGGAAEQSKAVIGASIEGTKTQISTRIASARAEVAALAAGTRAQIDAAHTSTLATIDAETLGATGRLHAAFAAAMPQVDAQETAGLGTVNTKYRDSWNRHRDIGIAHGERARARGAEYAAMFRKPKGSGGCKINKKDGFWAGYLTDRRAEASAKASEETAAGYAKQLERSARENADTAMQGRTRDRCAVIGGARRTRATLEDQLDRLLTALQAGREGARTAADATRAQLLASVDQAEQGALAGLTTQEHAQRQAANDAGYLQQATVEAQAHAAAATLRQAVAQAVQGLQSSLTAAAGRLSRLPAPDDEAPLAVAAATAEERITDALATVSTKVDEGLATAEAELGSTTSSAVSSLAEIVTGNETQAGEAVAGFAQTMATTAANAVQTLGEQATAYAAQVQQAATTGVDGMNRAVLGYTEAVASIANDIQTSLTALETDLSTGQDTTLTELDCVIPAKAHEAASKEQPAWKSVAAIILIIAVIVLVTLVIGPAAIAAAGAIFGAGTFTAAVVGGAIAGMIASGLIQVINNWSTGERWDKGLGRAMIIGAVTGALGGAVGFGLDKAFTSFVPNLLANFGADFVMDIGTQLGMQLLGGQGLSLANLDFGQALLGAFQGAAIGSAVRGANSGRMRTPRALDAPAPTTGGRTRRIVDSAARWTSNKVQRVQGASTRVGERFGGKVRNALPAPLRPTLPKPPAADATPARAPGEATPPHAPADVTNARAPGDSSPLRPTDEPATTRPTDEPATPRDAEPSAPRDTEPTRSADAPPAGRPGEADGPTTRPVEDAHTVPGAARQVPIGDGVHTVAAKRGANGDVLITLCSACSRMSSQLDGLAAALPDGAAKQRVAGLADQVRQLEADINTGRVPREEIPDRVAALAENVRTAAGDLPSTVKSALGDPNFDPTVVRNREEARLKNEPHFQRIESSLGTPAPQPPKLPAELAGDYIHTMTGELRRRRPKGTKVPLTIEGGRIEVRSGRNDVTIDIEASVRGTALTDAEVVELRGLHGKTDPSPADSARLAELRSKSTATDLQRAIGVRPAAPDATTSKQPLTEAEAAELTSLSNKAASQRSDVDRQRLAELEARASAHALDQRTNTALSQGHRNKHTERLGEIAADRVVGSTYPDARPIHTGDGPHTLDRVFVNDSPPPAVIVVEAKGGSGTNTSSRATDMGRAQQGSREYLLDLVNNQNSRLPPQVKAQIEAALDSGSIRYIEVSQPITPTGGLGDIKVREYDIVQ